MDESTCESSSDGLTCDIMQLFRSPSEVDDEALGTICHKVVDTAIAAVTNSD